MRLHTLGLTAVLAVAAFSALASPAQADHFYDRYRGQRYSRRGDSEELRRRDQVRSRLFELADRVRLAEREREITSREAGRLFEELDDVRDFLRDDHNLTSSEYRRRMDDLDDVERDLRRLCGRRGHGSGRYDQYDRYDRYDRYGRSDRSDRYDRRDRYDDYGRDDRYRRY